jgi:diacylglycerol O-acyltransferase
MVTKIAGASATNAAPEAEAAPRSERMSKVDTAWLRMDGEANLMMITGVWVLRPRVAYEALCQRVQDSLLKFHRFRQCVVEDASGATWVEDDSFDIRRHVLRERLPRSKRGHAQQALQERLARLAMRPLERAHPLWQFHLVEDYPLPDGSMGSALLMRIHHCIADGIALIAVTMSLVDGGAAPPPRRRRAQREADDDWFNETLVRPFTDVAVKALGAAGDGAAQALQLLGNPKQGLAGSLDLARSAYQLVSDLAALALMPDDSSTRLKGKPGRAKRVAWCEPLPLDEIKIVGKALGASINDVLLSCVAGAIGAYLRKHGDNPAGQEIRAMVPVNLRPVEEAHQLGNRFGLAPLVLPIGIENPILRVFEVRRRMAAMKGSFQPLLAFSLLAVAGLLVKPAQDAMLNLFGKKTTAVMTNVPGPREKIRFCGSQVEQILFWVPQSGDVGLGVSILSYAGAVQFGVITDSTLCPDPQEIIDAFEPEFIKLSWLTLMLPWGR